MPKLKSHKLKVNGQLSIVKTARPLEILAIIPARGGSKGIPRKNIKMLAGKPMIAHIIETVKAVPEIGRVIVSTEDVEIAAVAKKYGAEVPFLRPQELAEDQVSTLPVLQHALSELEARERYKPDYVLLVYPTSPLLSAGRISEAARLAMSTRADSVVSGFLDKGHFWIEKGASHRRLHPREVKNRQAATPLFRENGAIYLTRAEVLKKQIVADRMAPLIMQPEENIDIDEMADFIRAEEKLRAQGKNV